MEESMKGMTNGEKSDENKEGGEQGWKDGEIKRWSDERREGAKHEIKCALNDG